MHYELLKTQRGYITERQSVFSDTTQSTELSFSMPEGVDAEDCDLIVRVIDRSKRTCDIPAVKVTTGYVCKLPSSLMTPQILRVSAHLCRNNEVLQSWVCEPIRVSSFGMQLEAKRYIEPALCEQVEEEMTALNGIVSTQAGRITDMEAEQANSHAEIAVLKENNARLATALEDVVKQVALIESNYNIVETIKEEN